MILASTFERTFGKQIFGTNLDLIWADRSAWFGFKRCRVTHEKHVKKTLKLRKRKTRHDPNPKNQDSQIYSAKADPSK